MSENGFNSSLESQKVRLNAIKLRIEALESNKPPPNTTIWDSNLTKAWGRCSENGGNSCLAAIELRLKSIQLFIDQLEQERCRRQQAELILLKEIREKERLISEAREREEERLRDDEIW